MKCPYCFSPDTSVLDSRECEDGVAIRRRRTCSQCGRRFTTYERTEGVDLKVVKKDGQTEEFDREKIKRGLMKATWKRPVSVDQINQIIDEVEQKLRLKNTKEVKSWQIGNLVVNRLKKIDTLAYLLFATVYRDFASLADFEAEIHRLRVAAEKGDLQSPEPEDY